MTTFQGYDTVQVLETGDFGKVVGISPPDQIEVEQYPFGGRTRTMFSVDEVRIVKAGDIIDLQGRPFKVTEPLGGTVLGKYVNSEAEDARRAEEQRIAEQEAADSELDSATKDRFWGTDTHPDLIEVPWSIAQEAFERAVEVYPESRAYRDVFGYGAQWLYKKLAAEGRINPQEDSK